MSTRSLSQLIAGVTISLVILTACGGANVNGGAIKFDDLGSWTSPNKTDRNARTDFFRDAQVDSRPGIHFNTRHGEIAIIGQPDPMFLMVTFSREIW